jgi:subtilisin family serine protease
MICIFSGTKGTPLQNAYVAFERQVGESSDLPYGETDENGAAQLNTDIPEPAEGIDIYIYATEHETLIIPHSVASYEIVMPRILVPPNRLGWWHERCGISKRAQLDGSGIRVGIVDSGCHPTPSLKHVKDLGTVSITGYEPTDTGKDEDQHGTSVAAFIAGRPRTVAEFTGMAPKAAVFSVRVTFKPNPAQSNQSLIADALEQVLKHDVHLINCSFAFANEHQDVQRWLDRAWENGTLVICAAGNHIPTVGYPARWKNAVSVSALGQVETFRRHTDSSRTVPPVALVSRWDPPLFIPTFVPQGGKVDCIAPGVAVIAVEPPQSSLVCGIRKKSGTSFACPIVTGLLATALSRDEHYNAMPPTSARAQYAKAALQGLCQELRLDPDLQGCGLPVLPQPAAQ